MNHLKLFFLGLTEHSQILGSNHLRKVAKIFFNQVHLFSLKFRSGLMRKIITIFYMSDI